MCALICFIAALIRTINSYVLVRLLCCMGALALGLAEPPPAAPDSFVIPVVAAL